MYKIETRKDLKKAVRAILEGMILLAAAWMVVRTLTTNRVYQSYDPSDASVVSGADHGFLAVSYFGVDRQGTDTLISTGQLEEHLRALYELGYVTISQNDIENYYQNGDLLPDKALFLMFEDGRRDTALFASKILEKYNYRATILSYADKFEKKDPKFLSAKDLKKLERSGFWEIGTNGYRLAYINAYDRYDRFLGQMTSDEFVQIRAYLGRDYNHYLMDYIRDEDRVPVETRTGMENRIAGDYRLMEQIYSTELGYMPKLYCIMHSNTGMFGNHEKVSRVNAENMEDLFAMNFNRDGFAQNTADSSIYDLTRLQPQAYWSTNHLLMRIRNDLPEEEKETISFVGGDEKKGERIQRWSAVQGAVWHGQDQIVLTSIPQGEGILKFLPSELEDVELSVDLLGNKIGSQTVYLRADQARKNYLAVSLANNHLLIFECMNGEKEKLFDRDLHELIETKDRISIEEDKNDALVAEYTMRGRFAHSAADSMVFYQAAREAAKTETHSVKDGAEEYLPEIQILEPGNTNLKIRLSGDTLKVWVNEVDVAGEQKVSRTGSGALMLGAGWGGMGYSQRNIADDVYDGVFKNLVVKENETCLFDNRLHGIEKAADRIKTAWNGILNWFIKNL